MQLHFDFTKWIGFIIVVIFGVICSVLVPNQSFLSWLSDILSIGSLVFLGVILRRNKPGFIFNESGIYILRLPFLFSWYKYIGWEEMASFEFVVLSTENTTTAYLYMFKKWKNHPTRVSIDAWEQDHTVIKAEFRKLANKMNIFEFKKDAE